MSESGGGMKNTKEKKQQFKFDKNGKNGKWPYWKNTELILQTHFIKLEDTIVTLVKRIMADKIKKTLRRIESKKINRAWKHFHWEQEQRPIVLLIKKN